MNNYPESWQVQPLAEVADKSPNSLVDGPFGSNLKTCDYTDKGVRLIQLQNIGDGFWLDENKKFTSDKKYYQLIRHAVSSGDIVIAKMADPIARACIVPSVSDRFLVVADCIKLTPDKKKYHSQYLVYAINHHWFRSQAEKKSTGTTRQRINLSKLRTVNLLIPPLEEQKSIAKLLLTLDEAIQKTEQLIAKLKAIKQGLLQDLLTRGLDENGQLRDPIAHPEQFKDSPLGRIPKEWEVRCIKDVSENLDKFRVPISEEERAKRVGTVPYYGANGQQGWIDDYLFDEPLILLAEDGGDFDNFSSKSIAYRIVGKSWVNNHAHVVRPKSSNDFCFLFYSLEHKDIRFFIKGGTRSKLNKSELDLITIAWPKSQEERIAVGKAIENIELQKATETNYYNKLKVLKKGLMHDLLTGKVRVNIPSEETEHENSHHS